MKKLIALIFLMMYAANVIGATIHTHYCMGDVAGISLSGFEGKKCSKCGMEDGDKKGCCKDVKTELKIDSEHQKQHAHDLSFNKIINCITIFNEVDFNIHTNTYFPIQLSSSVIEDPPDIHSQYLYKEYCVFII